jgi:hypothetical protein
MELAIVTQMRRDLAANDYVVERIEAGHRYFRHGEDITADELAEAVRRRDMAGRILAGWETDR